MKESKNDQKALVRYLSGNSGYFSGIITNVIIYGLIYKIFGFEWSVVIALAHINSDQDWTNILIKRLK